MQTAANFRTRSKSRGRSESRGRTGRRKSPGRRSAPISEPEPVKVAKPKVEVKKVTESVVEHRNDIFESVTFSRLSRADLASLRTSTPTRQSLRTAYMNEKVSLSSELVIILYSYPRNTSHAPPSHGSLIIAPFVVELKGM